LETAVLPLHQAPEKAGKMSSHWKFEVHVKTPGERDDEEATVQLLVDLIRATTGRVARDDLAITVGDFERN
jgi:hypothetical protein